MTILVSAADLHNGLRKAKGIVERRNTFPILSNVLLEADVTKQLLSVRATDLDLELSLSIPANVAEKGATTVSAEMLFAFASKLPKDAQIKMAMDKRENVLRLSCARSRMKLPTLSVEDFPSMAKAELTHRFSLPSSELTRMFGRAKFAICHDGARYYLNGIYLHNIHDKLRTVATDGHRLALIDGDVPAGAAGMPSIIVPRKTVTQALNLCREVDSVEISLSPARIVFKFGETELSSKLIDATFPDYARVIPAEQNSVAFVVNSDLAAGVERVAKVFSNRGRAVKLSFSAGALNLSATNPDAGSANEEISIESDFDLDIGFNAIYLSQIVAEIDSDRVRIALSDPGSPAVIRGENDNTAIFILMPMRVS